MKRKPYDPLKPRITTLLWMLGPAVVMLSVYLIWPIFQTLKLSLYDWNGIDRKAKAIGFGNWVELFHDHIFWLSVKNSFILLFISALVEIPIGLGLAILIFRGGKRFRIFKFGYFFPFLMSTVGISILFKQIFDTNFGLINQVLGILHLSGLEQDWLGNKHLAIYTVALLICWQYIPFYMLLFLAALNGISPDIEEAAAIDGAASWKFTRYIQIPLIRGAMITALLLIVIGSLKYFDLIWVLTNGGPEFSTSVMASYLYTLAFKNYRVGYSSTVAGALFFIVFITAISIGRITKRFREV